jgi:hypothetical protein
LVWAIPVPEFGFSERRSLPIKIELALLCKVLEILISFLQCLYGSTYR